MSVFSDFIFNHKHYKEVVKAYNEATTKYAKGYSFWRNHHDHTDIHSYSFKEKVYSHLKEIKTLELWINNATGYLSSCKEAVDWLFHDNNRERPSTLTYDDLKLIGTNESKIKKYKKLLSSFNTIYSNYKDACRYFLKTSSTEFSFEQKLHVINNEEEIKRIANILTRVQKLKSSFPDIWDIFSNGRSLLVIPIEELKQVSEFRFSTKKKFLELYNSKKVIIELILGSSVPIASFDEDSLQQELFAINSLTNKVSVDFNSFDGSIKIEDGQALKRAILDSEFYGQGCKFADSFSISSFYYLRFDFEDIGESFDSALSKIKDNEEAVKTFNFEAGNERKIYIENYLDSVSPEKPLFIYLDTYQQQKAKRDETKRIQQHYPKGFEALFGSMDLDTCLLQDIQRVINSKDRIINKDNELKALERQRIERERKRQEEERKRQELRDLRSCVSNWPQPNRSSVNCFSLYYYYPTTCDWDASEDEWDVRNLIWDFKAKPHNYRSESEINQKHTNSVNKVLPDIEKVLRHSFGSNVSKLTFVPILASTRLVSERRYKDISFQLSNNLGMSNGYPYMSITKDGISKNDPTNTTGVSIQPEISLDGSFFKDRYVILFDDVITSGKSMERFKRLLESAGATVIGGLSIGKTKHERQGTNPIDNI